MTPLRHPSTYDLQKQYHEQQLTVENWIASLGPAHGLRRLAPTQFRRHVRYVKSAQEWEYITRQLASSGGAHGLQVPHAVQAALDLAILGRLEAALRYAPSDAWSSHQNFLRVLMNLRTTLRPFYRP